MYPFLVSKHLVNIYEILKRKKIFIINEIRMGAGKQHVIQSRNMRICLGNIGELLRIEEF